MAEILPAIIGVMACTRCLSVVAFTAATDFSRNDGKAWQYCPGCGESRWFIPFTPTPRTETTDGGSR